MKNCLKILTILALILPSAFAHGGIDDGHVEGLPQNYETAETENNNRITANLVSVSLHWVIGITVVGMLIALAYHLLTKNRRIAV